MKSYFVAQPSTIRNTQPYKFIKTSAAVSSIALRVIGISTKGTARLDSFDFQTNDLLVFGPETRGIPEPLLFSDAFDDVMRIPMQPSSRSLNLSNAVAIVAFQAWRQFGCVGAGA